MRVLWNNHRDSRNPRSGGAERTIQEVGGRLVARGHEVHLLTARWPGALAEDTVDGIRIHRYAGAPGPHLALPEIARVVRPDVVVDDLGHVVPWWSPQVTGLPGVAFFRHLHRRTLPGQVSRWLVPPLAALEHLFPTIYRSWSFAVESSSSAADLESLGVARDQITRIPPGVDLERFVPGVRDLAPSLVFFSGLREYKRPDHAVRALGLLRKRGIRAALTVVGRSPELASLERLATECGVADSVRFPGRLSDTELAATLARSWVNVNCSVAEGWGYSILESAASGVPTAAYDVPGVGEATGNGVAGVVVPDGDIPALSVAIAELLASNDLWRARCRPFAERFPWSGCAEGWERLLESAARGRR